MTRVKANFSQYDSTQAEPEVKNNQPDNPKLKACKVPAQIGGEIDCLMGIKYGALSPEPIHTLLNGLCLYRSKLMAHDSVSNTIIGGTHESFSCFANIAGGVAQLIASFQAGLQRFQEGCMPRISSNPITMKEVQAADGPHGGDGRADGE